MAGLMVKLIAPEDVHIKISRRSGKAIDLRELVYSHILLPVRSHFGRDARFAWIQPQDWIGFCNGEKVTIVVTADGRTSSVEVHHGEDRVVYVKPELVAAK
ncbi:MAG: hypothetical protein Q7S32_04725 [bacterium]|nr:hypothetical protein [bacterium]